MVVVDANVLLYAVNEDSLHHATARAWLDDALSGPGAVALPWIVLVAFLRIATNARILPDPLPIGDALDQVESWLEMPAIVAIDPTARHHAVLAGLLRSVGTGANLVNDAHLAALAVERNATIVTFDRDFGRFPGVRHLVPG